jgi:ATP-dependent helicase/nuclease subunit B
MEPFVQQLADLCRAHVTRCKWVFVPSHAIGRSIGERIALSGTNWLNLRFVTPLDVALRMGAPFLVERGIDPSEEGLGPALMMRLLLDLPTEGGYFRPLADQPTMAQALWTTIHELRSAGVKSGDLKLEAFESKAKYAELRALLASYEQFLTTNSRGDMAVVYEEAVKHPDWCPIQAEDCWTELPGTIWSPLQSRLIASLPGERILPRAFAIPAAATPRRLVEVPVSHVEPEPSVSPLAFLLTATGKLPADVVQLFHAGGRDAEIEEVFRRIIAARPHLDQVEIACGSDEHIALVWEKALRHDWAVTLGPGIPAASTRPGRALLGLLDWIETDFSAAHLRRLLESGDMGIEEDDEGFKAGDAARTLSRAQAGWGRATYRLSLGVLQKSYEARASDPDLSDTERDAAKSKALRTAKVCAWVDGLVASIPLPDARGVVSLPRIIDVALDYLAQSTARSSALDYRAAEALGEHVAELRALGAFECSLHDALRFVRERVETLQVAPDRPRPGHLYVCRLQHAGYSGRPHVFVVGLEEGRVFPAASEDPVLLDSEREAHSPALRRSADRIDEAVWAVLSRLATLSTGSDASVTMSYSTRDTREFRETYASWLMLQAFRLQQGDPAASYQAMKTALGEPVSCVPVDRERSATEAGWWLRSVLGSDAAGVAIVEQAFGALAAGRAAAARRESPAFTEFDGYVPDAGMVLDPCAGNNAFSVTELESAAACPFRFFLKRGLGLRPVDERERDKDVWLDPLTRGSALHDVYAALLRRCREAGRSADGKKDSSWLRQYAEQLLARLNQEMPPSSEEILARETADFLADVELFLDGECGQTVEPIGFEVSFGRPLGDEDEPLARAEPVVVDLGGGLQFRIAGRIDRIDKVGPSEFRILDYKTGGFWRADWQGTFAGGRRLQHALYGLAAVELLKTKYKKPRVTGADYYFSSHKGRQERVPIAAPPVAKTTAVLAELRELIVSGAFVHATDESSCKWCDFTAACGGHAAGQAQAKSADPKLDAFTRLAAHE